MKNIDDFSSWSDICSDCQTEASKDFYNRVKKGGKHKSTRLSNKLKPRAPTRPPGSVHKRCPSCRTHVWVIQTEKSMACWKCQVNLRISLALRDNTCHRGGVILSVMP